MSLIVETGSASPTAETYVGTAWADTYHAARGNGAWADLDLPDKETALRRATDYLGQAYRQRWKGYRVSTIQALDWPRAAVIVPDSATCYTVPINQVPKEVMAACAELALRAATAALAEDLNQGIVTESAARGLFVQYDPHSPQGTRYRAIDMLLAPLLSGGGAMGRLERA